MFKDSYEESGFYKVRDGQLILKNRQGNERVLNDEWNMEFTEERVADYVKADFSDSVRIIGEFNPNEQDLLEITDRDLEALEINSIRTYIDNPYAMEILESILPEEDE